MARLNTLNQQRMIEDPPFARYLFSDTRSAPLWLILRLWLGYQWLTAGLHKLFEYKAVPGDISGLQGMAWGVPNAAWMGTGQGILGYWTNAVKVDPRPVITFDWYRSFLQVLIDTNSHVWFSKVIVFAELAIGLGLIFGAFVGIAAFGGILMNASFLLAGTTSTNPVMLLLAIAVMLAWKTAGYLGLDRILLPLLGTPWRVVSRQSDPVRPVETTPLQA